MVQYMSSYLGICLKLSGTQGPSARLGFVFRTVPSDHNLYMLFGMNNYIATVSLSSSTSSSSSSSSPSSSDGSCSDIHYYFPSSVSVLHCVWKIQMQFNTETMYYSLHISIYMSIYYCHQFQK